MIREIEIRDLVVIERAHIEPVAGLTAITGETGAGKTVVAQMTEKSNPTREICSFNPVIVTIFISTFCFLILSF